MEEQMRATGKKTMGEGKAGELAGGYTESTLYTSVKTSLCYAVPDK